MGARKLGLWSGVGLTLADMVGTGVLTTAGFMALELSGGLILFDWFFGGLVAVSGAVAYGALARREPRSGGEYRYLSSMWHPALGYLAGWTSLLVGFSVPIALAALAAGAFGETLWPGLDGRILAVGLLGLTTVAHAFDLRTSRWAQDGLAMVKAVLLVGFIGLGLIEGPGSLPAWESHPGGTGSGFPVAPFFTSLIFIMFCYTGWNAATYASDEFENPRRDVPRAMLIGCVAVICVYLLVNWVFVTTLTREDMLGWIKGDTDRITLAHLVVRKLLGEGGAAVMSVAVIVALMSAISAMTVIGPRVYAEMARDGFLPRVLVARAGKPPVGSVLLQGGLAISLVVLSGFRELLTNVSAILAIVSAMTVLSVFRSSRWPAGEGPGRSARVGALVYAAMSGWMVYFAVQSSSSVDFLGAAVPSVILWMAVIVIFTMVGYAYLGVRRGRARAGGTSH